MAGSFTGSPAKQERSTADQTDQRAKDKTYGPTCFITLRTEEFKSQRDVEVRSQDEANDGEDNSNKEHGKNAKKDRDYSINHFRFSSNYCQFQ
jgi:preprotein translocase subunit SecF